MLKRHERRGSYQEERGFSSGAAGHGEPLLSAAELGMDEVSVPSVMRQSLRLTLYLLLQGSFNNDQCARTVPYN